MKARGDNGTLHERLVARLRREVAGAGAPGTRLPGDLTLARRFGVSNVTVRDAMLVLAEQGWVDRRRGSGTYVADRSRRQHVGVVTGSDLLHPDMAPGGRHMVSAIREELERAGFDVRLYMGRDTPWGPHDRIDCPAFHEAVAGDRLSALVAVGTDPSDWYAPVQAAGVPTVFAGDYRDRQLCCVFPDHEQLGRDAVRTLLQAGRRRIGLLQWVQPRPGGMPTPDGMWQGFGATLAQAGLAPEPAWVRRDLHPNWHGAGWSEFREIWAARPTKPDGLIVGDDMLFADAAEAITQLGIRVPEQLLVVAQTNPMAPPRWPFPVVAMEFDPQTVGRRTAAQLTAIIAGDQPPPRAVPFRQRWCGFPEADTAAAGNRTKQLSYLQR